MANNEKSNRRLLHTADVHLVSYDDSSRRGLEDLVSTAITDKVDMVIIAGDLFDHNRVEDELIRFAIEQLKRLPMKTLVLPGNHDCLVPGSIYDRADLNELWAQAANVHIVKCEAGETLDFPELGILVWARPICSYDRDTEPLKDPPEIQDDGKWHVGIAHGYFSNAGNDRSRSFMFGPDEIKKTGQDYLALGHWPAFRCVCEEPVAYYCESPTISGTVNIIELDVETGVKVTRRPIRNQ